MIKRQIVGASPPGDLLDVKPSTRGRHGSGETLFNLFEYITQSQVEAALEVSCVQTLAPGALEFSQSHY